MSNHTPGHGSIKSSYASSSKKSPTMQADPEPAKPQKMSAWAVFVLNEHQLIAEKKEEAKKMPGPSDNFSILNRARRLAFNSLSKEKLEEYEVQASQFNETIGKDPMPHDVLR